MTVFSVWSLLILIIKIFIIAKLFGGIALSVRRGRVGKAVLL